MRKIVIADGDPLIRRLAMNSLASAEFDVREAGDGPEAVRLAQELQPDVILLDPRLSRLSGVALCQAVRTECSLARVVVLVGDEEPEAECLQLANERLDKPFSPMGLLRLINRQLGALPNADSGEPRVHEMERQQLLLYARDLARLRREDLRKTQELKEAKQRLEQLEKDKDMFLALVSHELRTPLTIIKGNAHLLRRVLGQAEGQLQERLLEFSQAMVGASDRLERLIMEMLNYSGMRAGLAPFERRETNLDSMLQSVVRELQGTARSRQVRLTFKGSERHIVLRADETRLREAFAHLVKNAILFNRPDGAAQVECQEIDQGARVVVSDTGVGMPSAELNKVFLPFYQAQEVLSRSVEGLGLGLAIARHIIFAHGGTIELDSEVGKGTRVKVFLPWLPADEAPAPPTLESLESPPATLSSQRLLEYARELYAAYEGERIQRHHAEETAHDLERTFVETLALLMRLVDHRTGRGPDHLERVAFYATEIARQLDSALAASKDFRYALMLHDLGNLGLAESLLQKVGTLTHDELSQLRTHSSLGADLLESVAHLRPAIKGVRHHHERWDGRGYPDGLSGHDIPLVARIIAVADSFDAMTSDRPYRKSMDLPQAKAEIMAQAGAQFDPDVVDAFLARWDSILAYREEASE